METDQFENLLIGSGEANKYLAWSLAKSGQRTAVVERSLIGGSCPNIVCLPSKNVIHSAKVASLVNRAAEFGISIGPARVEMAGVFSRKPHMVDEQISGHLQRYRDSGAELIMGEARFAAPNTVGVTLQSGGVRIKPASFLKELAGPYDRILGFAALGAEASEFLAAVQTAMLAGMPYQTLRDAIFTHPTMAEGLGALFTNLTSAT